MPYDVSNILIISLLIVCAILATGATWDDCTFKESKILSAPDRCCFMKEDFYREKWHSVSQFPMKIVFQSEKLHEVTRIQKSNNVTNFYFGKEGEQDILHKYLSLYYRLQEFFHACGGHLPTTSLIGRRRRYTTPPSLQVLNARCTSSMVGYKICMKTKTSLGLKTLLMQPVKSLSNCGTGIIFKNSQLGKNVEYFHLCQCVQPLAINSSELRKMTMLDAACGKRDYCLHTDFLCNNNRCLPVAWRCDGEDDCGDASDEQECEKDVHCGSFYFQCGEGSCVLNTSMCDGKIDCDDGSDEQKCAGDFLCSDGTNITYSYVCDRSSDCSDGSDEANCSSSDYCTSRGYFRCGDGICKSNNTLCDGYKDCRDGSDETICLDNDYCTERGKFHCENNGKCVGVSSVCDGSSDCEDSSDESNCTHNNYCTERGKFHCENNGKCVHMSSVCDGSSDCEDSSDESNCTQQDYCTEREEFRCLSDGICKTLTSICDGDPECKDGSDERDCAETDHCTRRGLFHCKETGRCVPYDSLCNKYNDCGEDSDEKYCTIQDHCTPHGSHRCGDGSCKRNSWVCDGSDDCDDGSDEYNCTEMFVHAPNLKEMAIDFRTFMKISYSEETQNSVTKIEIIYSQVYIERVIEKVANFQQLKYLDLSNSVIYNAPIINVISIVVKSIEYLNLSHCGINNLDSIPLNVFPHLKFLDLHFNQIKISKPDTFFYLHNIIKLNLSMSFDRESIIFNFNTSTKMDYLDLSNNRLDVVEIHLTGEVNVLDLSNNRLKYSNVKIINNATSSVNYLDLRGNKIKLNGQLFENIKAVNIVDIQDYRLDCADCTTLLKNSLQNVLRNTSEILVIYNSTYNVPRCTSPEEHADKMFEDVNLCSLLYTQICTSYWIIILIVAAVIIILLILVVSGIGYKYRFEILYWIQYVKLKKRKLASCYCDADGYEYDAFISYCAADRRWVWIVLRPGLEESLEKYRLCLHERDFLLGSQIKENIDNSMKTSRYCIMILSNDFIESQWCRFELEHAGYKLIEDKREFLIIIELEPLDMRDIPSHLKQLIETRTYLEWNLQKFGEQVLLERLKSALGQSIFEKNLESKGGLEYLASEF